MNYRKLIQELFYSTNKCNRSLAFELAKSTHCHAEVVEELYTGLLELPHFALLADAHQIPASIQKASVKVPLVEEELAVKQQCIEQFCDTYFHKQMNLNGYHLNGSTTEYLHVFPKVLLQCTFLEQLDLSHNDLKEIPKDIGCLHNLHTLNLSSNPEIKVLPPSMCALKNLEHLNLSGIFDLFAVELSDCRVLHIFPTVLRSLRHLRHLNLQDVMLDGLPTWINELEQLQTLHLFSGSRQHPPLALPSTFTQLPQLETLTIDAFTVAIPEDIDALVSLKCLVVNHAKAVPAAIGQLRHLRYLDLSYLSPDFPLHHPTYKTLGELPEDWSGSRLDLFGWNWLLEMTDLEEFIYKHKAPYKFTSVEIALLQKALPNCTFSLE